MKYCIVSAADQKYFEFLAGLIASLAPIAPPLVVVDLGLTATQRAALEAQGIRLITFTYPLEYPARRQVESEFPGFGGMLCRPYLNELVPGYDVLVWMDADTWAQEPAAVLELIDEAWRHGMAAIPEIDRAYYKFREGYHVWDLETRGTTHCFGPEVAARMRHVPTINGGFWAARTDLRLWQPWRRYLYQGLSAVAVLDDATRVVEQIAFNLTIQVDRLPVRRFPATYNWLACLAAPAWHMGKSSLVEPDPPYTSIQIMHISTHLVGKSVVLPLIGGNSTHVHGVVLTWQGINMLEAFMASQGG